MSMDVAKTFYFVQIQIFLGRIDPYLYKTTKGFESLYFNYWNEIYDKKICVDNDGKNNI